MARPRAYAADQVVRTARELFWERGYEATSLADLEERTGLNRSSLYAAFGSKRGLFERALESYLLEVAEPSLLGVERPGAGLDAVIGYLRGLGEALQGRVELAARGCLMVNTIAELATRDPAARDSGQAYRDRIAAALTHALTAAAAHGDLDRESAPARARILTATVMGILLTARFDPADAADLARATADEVAGWRVAAGRAGLS